MGKKRVINPDSFDDVFGDFASAFSASVYSEGCPGCNGSWKDHQKLGDECKCDLYIAYMRLINYLNRYSCRTYEYKFVPVGRSYSAVVADTNWEQVVVEHGQDGWELVQIIKTSKLPVSSNTSTSHTAIFKRAI